MARPPALAALCHAIMATEPGQQQRMMRPRPRRGARDGTGEPRGRGSQLFGRLLSLKPIHDARPLQGFPRSLLRDPEEYKATLHPMFLPGTISVVVAKASALIIVSSPT